MGSLPPASGSLDPRHAAATACTPGWSRRRDLHRALAQLGLGTPARWCVPLPVVSASRSTVLGACGFKTAPIDGRVEISYGIAPAERGRGFATVAIGELLQLAASSGLVREVVADILPGNVASSRLVVRMGFSPAGLRTDVDGVTIMRWACRLPHDGASGPDPLRRNA